MRLIILPLALSAWTFLLTACSPSAPDQPVSAETFFPLQVGEAKASVQLALAPEEQSTGLMHRGKLGEDEGMLFVYPKPGSRHFWMMNTMIPLDLGHFDADGVLLEVLPLHPNDTTRIPSSSPNVQFSLETNRGWFQKQGLIPGSKISIPEIEQAITSRGFDPKEFGLGGN